MSAGLNDSGRGCAQSDLHAVTVAAAAAWSGELDLQAAQQSQQLLDARLAHLPQTQVGQDTNWQTYLR